jgi:hypothetical protein
MQKDYDGAAKFLLLGMIMAVVQQCSTHVCGDAGVNKCTALL